MAEQIQMGAYRLVALSYNGTNPDKGGVVLSSRVAVLYAEKPLTRMATYRVNILSSKTRNPDQGAAVQSARIAALYLEAPVTRMATYRVNVVSSTTRNPDINVAAGAGRIAFLIRPPTMMAHAGRIAFLINQQETGPAAFVPQVFMRSFQQADWPTLANTISITSLSFNAMMVVQGRNDLLPQSDTKVMSLGKKVLQVLASPFEYSASRVWSNVMMALQSDLHEHVAVSMDYVLSVVQETLQSTPLPMWQSPHFALSLAQWELYRTPMGFMPRSTSTGYQVALKVAQATPMGTMPWSNTEVRSVALKYLFDYVSPLPDQGTNEVFQNVALTLQHTDGEPNVVGPNQVNSLIMQEIFNTPLPIWQSDMQVRALSELTLQHAYYDSPEDMGKLSAMQSVMKVVSAEDYQDPALYSSVMRSYQVASFALQKSDAMPFPAGAAIVPQAHIEWLQAANYPSPGDMVPPVNAALVSEFGILAAQKIVAPAPQSDTRMLEMAQLTSQYLFYTPASDLATKGLFIGLFAEVVSQNVLYPDPAEPVLPAFVDQLAVIAAIPDDKFPDPTKEAKPGEAFQVVETYATGVDYPDPSVSQVWAETTQVVEILSVDISFPDPSLPVSSAQLTQISIQDATNADYPDPANLVSPAVVSQVVGQVSLNSSFPNPNNPASTLTVNNALQMVAIPDVTLYGVPDYAIKHRPIITISIVYIQTS